MSGFCGFAGKTDGDNIRRMTEVIDKNCGYAPVQFSDGYFGFGFAQYLAGECDCVGHNENFTIWAMVDVGCVEPALTAKAIIEAYEKEGTSFVKELEGTFSVVLWDGIRKRLYLIRDRYGAKPLFYAKTQNGFAFATEINALLQCDGVNRNVNTAALYQYLSYQSVYVPDTVFEQVHHILPGFYGIYADGKFEEIAFADVPFGKQSEDGYEEAASKLQTLLCESVNRCLSEENAGVFLSGGLDSGLVTALAKKGSIQHSFCLKPVTGKNSIHKKEEDVYFSAELAKEYGIRHYVWKMTPKDLTEGIDDVIRCFAQPFSGTMSTYFLAKEASKVCRGILTGDGADELFGSYRHHSVVMPLEKYALLKESRAGIAGREKELAPYDKTIPFLDSLYRYGGKDDTLWYYRLLLMGDGEKGIFLNKERFGEWIDGQYTLRQCVMWDKELKSQGVLNRSLERDFKHLLPGHTMLYQDTLARNFGMNLGMPFLNNRLTNYVVALPQEYKIRDGVTKAVLREAGKGVLPKKITERRKEPFSLPITEWLKTDLQEYLTDVLCEDSVKRYGLLDSSAVQYALNEFYKYPNTKEYYAGMLWTMAMLQKWAMLYM